MTQKYFTSMWQLVFLWSMFYSLYELQIIEVSLIICVCQAKHFLTLIFSESERQQNWMKTGIYYNNTTASISTFWEFEDLRNSAKNQSELLIAFDRTHTILRRFSSPWVLRCPAGIDHGCSVSSGYRRYLGPCDTLNLAGIDLKLIVTFKSTRLWPCL